MPGTPVKIGPFVGGLNTYSGPTSIADNEARELINFDIDIDGSLKTRPPVNNYWGDDASTCEFKILCMYRDSAGANYAIITENYDSGAKYTVAFSFNTQVRTIIYNGIATAAVQYSNKVWIVSPVGSTWSGSWEPIGGYAAVAGMPPGNSIAVYKDRLFIATVGGDGASITRVKFSGPANPSSWTGTDLFEVATGDGQNIIKLLSFDGTIAIFKKDSTYLFGYDTSPTKGQVQIINAIIGLATDTSLAIYENAIYAMHKDSVYKISGWNWSLVNLKVPFGYFNPNGYPQDKSSDLSIVEDRLFVRYYSKYYVFGLKTQSWTEWSFTGSGRSPTQWFRLPTFNATLGTFEYFSAGAYKSSAKELLIFKDAYEASNPEDIQASVATKIYNFDVPYSFKRLFWWGVDMLSKSPVTFLVQPTAYSTTTKWGQILGIPMPQLGTWGRPLDVPLDVTDYSSFSNPTGSRLYIKLLKALRFRQVSFKLSSTVDGTTATGPLRIFSLTAFVDNKQLISKRSS